MKQTTARRLLSAAALVLLVTPAFGQRASEEMTPDEQAMMEAYLKAGYTGVQRSIGATDNAGHCSIWGSWPNN